MRVSSFWVIIHFKKADSETKKFESQTISQVGLQEE